MHLSHFAYASTMAPACNATCVPDIIKVARTFNHAHDITGMLVFDGQRFFQYIEGPDTALRGLIAAIAQDRRHVQFTPRLETAAASKRMFGQWSMAYVLTDDEEPLSALAQVRAPALLPKLQEMLPLLDVA